MPSRVRLLEQAVRIEHAQDLRAELPGPASRKRTFGHPSLQIGVERAQTRFTLAQRLFGLAPLVDVDDRADVAQILAVLIEPCSRRVDDPAVDAIGAAEAEVDAVITVFSVRGGEGLLCYGSVLGMYRVESSISLAGIWRLARELIPTGI